MRFRTILLQTSKTATGVRVPESVMTELGGGRAPKVVATIDGHHWRTSVATIGGGPMVGVNADVRAATGVQGGEEIEIDLVLDTAPRTIEVPDDLARALDAEPAARRTFDALSYSNQRFWVEPIVGAKSDETRQRRIDRAVATLREGRAR
jgi:hypothetical protein